MIVGHWFLPIDIPVISFLWFLLRYASAEYAVCLSQAGIVSKRLDKSSWFLAWRFSAICPTVCDKEIILPPKVRVLSCGTLSNPFGLRSRDQNFRLPVCNNFNRKSFIILIFFDLYRFFIVFVCFPDCRFLFLMHVLVFILPFLPLLCHYFSVMICTNVCYVLFNKYSI